MGNPLVSIITITYNSAKTVEQTILSVVSQDYLNIEYIVVDGGSTDGTLDIIRKYEDRIAKCVSEPDNGPTDAANKGIRIASGDIIALLHSDDFYADNTVVRRMVEVFEQSDDIKLVYGIQDYIDPVTGKLLFQWGREEAPSEIRKRMYLPFPTIFCRKEVYETAGVFREEYDYATDYEWAIRVIAFTRPRFLNYRITCMRDSGRSGKNYRETMAESARALKEHGYYKDYVLTLIRNYIKLVLIKLGLKNLVFGVWQKNVRPRN